MCCVVSSTSCFAPRATTASWRWPRCAPSSTSATREQRVRRAVPVPVRAGHQGVARGRVDGVVQSTDKNFLVPVGGAVLVSPARDPALTDAVQNIPRPRIHRAIPGRAHHAPQPGRRGVARLTREDAFEYMRARLRRPRSARRAAPGDTREPPAWASRYRLSSATWRGSFEYTRARTKRRRRRRRSQPRRRKDFFERLVFRVEEFFATVPGTRPCAREDAGGWRNHVPRVRREPRRVPRAVLHGGGGAGDDARGRRRSAMAGESLRGFPEKAEKTRSARQRRADRRAGAGNGAEDETRRFVTEARFHSDAFPRSRALGVLGERRERRLRARRERSRPRRRRRPKRKTASLISRGLAKRKRKNRSRRRRSDLATRDRGPRCVAGAVSLPRARRAVDLAGPGETVSALKKRALALSGVQTRRQTWTDRARGAMAGGRVEHARRGGGRPRLDRRARRVACDARRRWRRRRHRRGVAQLLPGDVRGRRWARLQEAGSLGGFVRTRRARYMTATSARRTGAVVQPHVDGRAAGHARRRGRGG